MDLQSYLDKVGIPKAKFARRAKITDATLNNIIKRNQDIRISIAYRICEASDWNITFEDLIPNMRNEEKQEKRKHKKKNED